MNKNLRVVLGSLLVSVGLIWTLHGLGVIQSRSPMTGVTFWALVGPIVSVSGFILVARALRR